MPIQEISKLNNAFYAEIRELLQKSRSIAYQVVNTVMVNTYWQIGKRIVEQEQHGKNRANYGDALITNLSRFYLLPFPRKKNRIPYNLNVFRRQICGILDNFIWFSPISNNSLRSA